jgi:hypothetical protein
VNVFGFWFLVFAHTLNAFFNAAALKKGFINTSAHQHIKHNLSAVAESV